MKIAISLTLAALTLGLTLTIEEGGLEPLVETTAAAGQDLADTAWESARNLASPEAWRRLAGAPSGFQASVR